MRFYGNGVVWGENSALCRFTKRVHDIGVLDTNDLQLIDKLIALGYRHDTQIIETISEEAPEIGAIIDTIIEAPDYTRHELMNILDDRGIKYDKRAKKEELTRLVME